MEFFVCTFLWSLRGGVALRDPMEVARVFGVGCVGC